MTITMFDLAGQDDNRRLSQFCWRTKFAFAHKGLDVDVLPWRFTEKDRIAGSGQGLVPVVVDGDETLNDSWQIALHLEQKHADRPSLFGGETGLALSLFIKNWVDGVVTPLIAKAIITGVFDVIHEKDKAYFRETREKRFGVTLEEFCDSSQAQVDKIRASLAPARATLGTQEFLGGNSPSYADYLLAGVFLWARASSPVVLLESDDPVHSWRERMLDLYDGLARNTTGFDV